MSLILVAKKSGKRVDLSKVVKNGKYTELAVPGEEYYVIDSETGKTPADIEVSRSGDDLIIKSPSEDITVVIDEFWHDCTPETQCYAIFDVPAVDGLEAGQVTVTQVGPDVSAFKPGMVGILPEDKVIAPWIWAGLGAAALLGGLASGGGGGGGGSSQPSKDTTAPEIKDGSLDVSGDGKQVTGKTEPGATVTVKDENGKTIGTGTADQNGNFTIPVNPPKTNGETLTVTAQDKAGNTSEPETVKADDSTAPVIKDGSLDVSGDGKQVTGKTEPGATVTVKDENGKTIGTGTADQNGNFTIPVNPPKTNGETLTVTAQDKAGNTSDPETVKADDNTAPAAPTNLDVSDDGSSVSGKAEPGATVTIRDENGNPIGEGKADQNGDFNIPLDTPKTNGESLTAEATDGAGNTSSKADVKADDTVKPDAPKDLVVSPDGSHVSGTAEPGTTVTIRDEKGNPIGSDIVKPDGTFNVGIKPPKTNGELLTAEATDGANHTSPQADVTAGDTTAPTKPIGIEFLDDNNPKTPDGEPVTLSRNEFDGASDKSVAVRVFLPKDGSVKAGDSLIVKAGDETITVPLETQHIKDKFVDVDVPTTVGDGATGPLSVSAQLQDASTNKNTSEPFTAEATVDRTADGVPNIAFSENINGDKFLRLDNTEVLSDGNNTTKVRVTLPAGMEDQDTAKVIIEGKEYTVDLTAKKVYEKGATPESGFELVHDTATNTNYADITGITVVGKTELNASVEMVQAGKNLQLVIK